MTKLSYEEWEKWYIDTECISKRTIEFWKTQYFCGMNAYDEFKMILREDYERYCKEND